MKRFSSLLVCLFLGMGLSAQTVENIRVDQEGENILVHFRIGGSTDAQTYRVALSCSVDGGPRFEPGTVFGDVGENIRGGKSNYTITWDVFEDRDEIGEAEFFVSVELTGQRDDEVPGVTAEAEKTHTDIKVFLAYTGSTNNPLGLSTGMTLGNWGGYLSYRFGSDEVAGFYAAGVMRKIFEKNKYKLLLYVGTGAVFEYWQDLVTFDSDDYAYMMGEGGIINTIGRVTLTLGVEYTDWVYPVFGLGYMFPIKRKAK